MEPMIPRVITGFGLRATVDHIVANRPLNSSLLNALANAETRLLVVPWSFDGVTLRIVSHSQPGQIHIVTRDTCDCLTSPRYWCWHRAAYMILASIAAAGVPPLALLPLPTILDEDELPASSFLDGPFDAFDDDSLTAPDAPAEPFYEDVPVMLHTPLPQRRAAWSRELVPEPGSELARAQALVDELAA